MRTLLLFLCLGISSYLHAQDGALDLGFGNNGIVQTDFYGFDDYLWDIEPQSNGKILAAGSVLTGGGSFDQVVIRYNSDGSLDNGFGSGGTLLVGTSGTLFIEVMPDDTFVAIRSSDLGNGDINISKYSQDGVLDTSYGVNGFAEFNYFEIDVALSFVLLDDDSMVVAARSAGQGMYFMTLFKVLANGNLDTSFGDAGYTAIDIGESFNQVIIQLQNGNALITSLCHDINSTESVIETFRFNMNGELDSTFGDNGIATLTFQSTGLHSNMAVNNDGDIILISTEWNDVPEPEYTTTMFKYHMNGTPDNSFAQQGSYVFNTGFFSDRINIQPNNRILVSGGIPDFEASWFTMSRFYSSGFPDPSFSFAGYTEFEGVDVELTPDERIIAAGFSYWFDGDIDFVLTALNNSPLGVEDFESNEITVYPNPTAGILNIQQQGFDVTEITLTDIHGRLLREIQMAEQQISLDLSSLRSGIYFLNQGNSTIKILKQ